MDWLPLTVLPPALAGSITVTVWLGAMIVAVTNLRLGWVLSGLVVPGYMVPLIIANPVSAAVVFAEGIATYLVVWLYSEVLAPRLRWSTFFGRDRFFALVLVSVGVRLAGDGWLLPALGVWLDHHYSLSLNYRNDLHSFGLIVVSLIANNFWKTGMIRGALPMGVQVVLTWLLVRMVLVPLTNFNAESTAVLYEDIAASMLASPKAYIILIVTAFVASRLNLFYGWDFSGILIPSLLALQWYQPFKIVATFGEAIAILALANWVLKLPYFRSITVEGGRKIMLFFSLSLAYKFVVGWGLAWWQPQLLTSDYYGFGYLLATLIAIKAHDKNILGRLSQSVLQTSLAGVAVATLIGFVLILIPDPVPLAAPAQPLPADPQRLDLPLADALAQAKTTFYRTRLGEQIAQPLPNEVQSFSDGVQLLMQYRNSQDPVVLRQARVSLDAAGYQVAIARGPGSEDILILSEREPHRHWGLYAISMKPKSPILLEVPFPVDEPPAFEAASLLLVKMGAAGFGAAPAQLPDDRRRRGTVLNSSQTIFQAFHREMFSDQVLQVRSRPSPAAQLRVSGGLPSGLDLPALRSMVGPMEVVFGASSERNLQRETTRGSFSELWIGQGESQRALVFASSVPLPERQSLPASVEATVLERMHDKQLAAPGSEGFRRPALDQLLRMDLEVLTPMAKLAHQARGSRLQDAAALATLAGAVSSARAVGLELSLLSAAEGDFLALHDRTGHGGLIMLRVGTADPYIFEVPRSVGERATLDTAVRLWSDLQAHALIIAGAASDANADGSADVLDTANKQTLFQLAHQTLLREFGQQPAVALQVRAMGIRPDHPPPGEAVLSFARAPADSARLDGVARQLLDDLQLHGLTPVMGTGENSTAGYGASGGPQAAYMEQARDKHFAVLWVARQLRAGVHQDAMDTQRRAFEGLGIPTRQQDISSVVATASLAGPPISDAVRQAALRYLATQDIVALSAFKNAYGDPLERIEDRGGRGAFLLLRSSDGRLRGVLSLAEGGRSDQRRFAPPGPLNVATLQEYLSARERWLEVSP